MTTSTGSSMVGRSYIMSSIMFSMIERRALAPVFMDIACSAIAITASLNEVQHLPLEKLLYCLRREF